MKKTVLLFLGVLFLLSCSRKKLDYSEKTMDSIPIYLVLANEDSVSYQKRMVYNKKAFDVFINQENDSMNRVNLFKIANRYFNMDNMEEYQKTTRIVLEKAERSDDILAIAKACYYLGDYYADMMTRKDSAYFFIPNQKDFIKKQMTVLI
ncbi:hypothetical protein [Flavobacterium microcysteis]|uniref:Uncharacterized protein n=1 Tax=Flavobacterium microcysteis TaxID=2596891 RepID=A0A501PYL4_9FLAO|nr:hypothetical protein [Flavobacterium microcysteis]TPD65298.1 hypothetical protein FJA49_13930 [Flavobacterium microcysteis]